MNYVSSIVISIPTMHRYAYAAHYQSSIQAAVN